MNVLMALLHLYGRLVLDRSRGERVLPAPLPVLVPVPIAAPPTGSVRVLRAA